jgi:hypothetical protein
MSRKPTSKRTRPKPKAVLRLPDLDQAKSAVLNSLTSGDAQRRYRHAIDEFVDWYCSKPLYGKPYRGFESLSLRHSCGFRLNPFGDRSHRVPQMYPHSQMTKAPSSHERRARVAPAWRGPKANSDAQ